MKNHFTIFFLLFLSFQFIHAVTLEEQRVVSACFVPSSIIKPVLKDLTFTDCSSAEGTIINSWSWDFNGDGVEDSNLASPVHQYNTPGVYPVRLIVSDGTVTSSLTKRVTIIGQVGDTCFSYIPVQGLESEGMGAAAWNVWGVGSEAQAIGHALPQPPSSGQVAYYYLASRNYGGIDAASTGAMHAIPGMERWPELENALTTNGYTPEDIKFSFGLMSLGNDVQNVDWFFNGNVENRIYQGGTYSIKLRGENFIHGNMPQFNMRIENLAYLGQTDKISGETGYGIPLNNSLLSSPQVKSVAAAFLADCGTAPIKFIFSSIQMATQFDFSGNARFGGFFEIPQGFIIKSCLGGSPLTSFGEINDHEYQVKTLEGRIMVTGLDTHSYLRLTDLTGKQLSGLEATESTVEIELNKKGVFLLSIENIHGSKTSKIISW